MSLDCNACQLYAWDAVPLACDIVISYRSWQKYQRVVSYDDKELLFYRNLKLSSSCYLEEIFFYLFA